MAEDEANGLWFGLWIYVRIGSFGSSLLSSSVRVLLYSVQEYKNKAQIHNLCLLQEAGHVCVCVCVRERERERERVRGEDLQTFMFLVFPISARIWISNTDSFG